MKIGTNAAVKKHILFTTERMFFYHVLQQFMLSVNNVCFSVRSVTMANALAYCTRVKGIIQALVSDELNFNELN